MKKTFVMFLCLFVLIGTAQDAYAQKKDKKAKKEKEAKAPKMSKSDMTIKIENLQSALSDLENQKSSLSSQLDDTRKEVNNLKSELEASQAAMQKLKDDAAKAPAAMGGVNPKGLTFRIQVGAYNEIDLANLFAEPKMITAEKVGGLNKYMIGHFESFEAARSLEAALQKAGIKDAWLVPYNDGGRISDAEAADLLGMPIRNK